MNPLIFVAAGAVLAWLVTPDKKENENGNVSEGVHNERDRDRNREPSTSSTKPSRRKRGVNKDISNGVQVPKGKRKPKNESEKSVTDKSENGGSPSTSGSGNDPSGEQSTTTPGNRPTERVTPVESDSENAS